MTSKRNDPIICQVCKEVYIQPKFLPCFHTFCSECVRSWANRRMISDTSEFPCPVCREPTTLPVGGVEGLPANFYFSPEELEGVRKGHRCTVRRRENLDLFCVSCVRVVCETCVDHYHRSHHVLDRSEATRQMKKRLEEGRENVQGLLETMERKRKSMEGIKKQHENELAITKRMARCMIIGPANVVYNMIVAGLQSYTVYLEKELHYPLQRLYKCQQEMTTLSEQLHEAATSGDVAKMIPMINEIKDGKGSHSSMSEMYGACDVFVIRPKFSDIFLLVLLLLGTVLLIYFTLSLKDSKMK